jgi:hypothetical protein
MDGRVRRRKARVAVEIFGLPCVSFEILSLVDLPFCARETSCVIPLIFGFRSYLRSFLSGLLTQW